MVKLCLETFCLSFGQQISFEKSRLYCSPNTSNALAMEISDLCGSPLTNDLRKYFGVSHIHSRVSKNTYKEIVEKTQKRLVAWKAYSLSLASRMTLI